jgi:thiol:disulfide interchange protein DsbD
MKKLLIPLLLATSFTSLAGNFLPVDQAFKFGYVKQDKTLQVFWNVAEDYHLYKSKIRFEPSDAVDIEYWPEGKIMHDNAYGQQELYYGQVTLKAKIKSDQEITIFYQGCKLNELCYMPQRVVIK